MGVFLRFLKCTNGTRSPKVVYIVYETTEKFTSENRGVLEVYLEPYQISMMDLNFKTVHQMFDMVLNKPHYYKALVLLALLEKPNLKIKTSRPVHFKVSLK